MSNVKVKTLVSNMLTKMTFIEAEHEFWGLLTTTLERLLFRKSGVNTTKCVREGA